MIPNALRKSKSLLFRWVCLMLIPIFVLGCSRHQQVVSAGYLSREAKLGAEIHEQITQSFNIFVEPTLQAYVEKVGRAVVGVAKRKDLVYQFIILDDERVYATHAPGGYVYLTTGFFRFLQSEIELAGILAHEIAALQYKNPRLSKAKKTVARLIQVGGQVAPAFGAVGALAYLGVTVIGIAVTHEKSAEKLLVEADKRALNYMAESGFDPQGFVHPFERMQDASSSFRPYLYDYLQSHPVTEKRYRKLLSQFEDLALENREFHAGRDAYLEVVEPLMLAS